MNPTVSAHASGSRHMRPNTRGLAVSMSTSGPAARACTSSAIHGIIATTANTAQSPSETRQPAASATGTATSGGVSVARAMVVE